ncbi:hypothetical protein M0802_005335 [Mischocyttarus mexicanus]|nr:hypothetical protein M0802_005335 [Mischocyttarus mexicanus]
MSLRKELYEPLNKMFTTKMHADVKIIVNNVEFLSHKAVLAAKSSVFDNIFKIRVNYKVEDLKSDVSKLAIYTFFPTNVDMWINLSQQYDLPYIKKMAETYTRHCEDAQLPNFFGS